MTPSGLTKLSKKRKSIKKRKLGTTPDEIPPLYKEDLGVEGIKKQRTVIPTPLATFELPMTLEERKRRKERKVRGAGTWR
jgi:hypothetical protein